MGKLGCELRQPSLSGQLTQGPCVRSVPRGLGQPCSLVTVLVCVALRWVRPLCRLVCMNWKLTGLTQEGRGMVRMGILLCAVGVRCHEVGLGERFSLCWGNEGGVSL